MLSEDTIIRAENLSKSYRIWSSPLARLRGPLCRRAAGLPLLPRKSRERLRQQAESASREFFALHDVSFEIARGESVGIIGRNGAGKSTLLQILTGTLQPTAGVVEVRGRTAALLELGSGFNPDFTGRENVRLNATLHGLSAGQIDARMEAILAFAEIGDFVDELVKTYSSGMLLRLAFAVIAHIDADVLIIDEALAVGDVFFVQKCMAFLRAFQEKGVLLLVSHDPSSITALCDKAIWLHEGHARRIGSPKEVTEAYLEAFFSDQAAAQPKRKPARAVQNLPAVSSGAEPAGAANALDADAAPQPVHDQRLVFLNHTQFRNDLELARFDPSTSSPGLGGGRIVEVVLEDDERRPLAWAVGGEVVTLKIVAECEEELASPILGFFLKNHLGQWLFGDNTYLSTLDQLDRHAPPGTRLVARFRFQLPLLPAGDYTILAALADGSQESHVMHHWIHDALAFKALTSSVAGGLVGLPMLDVRLERSPAMPRTYEEAAALSAAAAIR
jgi:lipopolysaccharide transport system ATP-binding protein